jgi:purine-binding chemotaxis protein CheW
MRHVVFRLEKALYALPLASVREVFPAPGHYTRVPRAPKSVRGVLNLRGRVVPVVELAALLELPPGESKSAKVVLLDFSRRELGLLVTEVEGIENLDKLSPPPARSAAVKGVARLGARPVTVLDPDGTDAAVAAAFTRG